MRLTAYLLNFGHSAGGGGRRFQGFQWIGKHRRPHRITPKAAARYIERLKIEEQNLFYLRHPYLTYEQECGHSKELQKHEKWTDKRKIEDKTKRLMPSKRIEDHVGFLNVNSQWELN